MNAPILLASMLAQTQPATQAVNWELNTWGWLTMILSVGFVTTLLVSCIVRVLRESSAKKLHAPADVDTHDRE